MDAPHYPFSAIVGQDTLQLALILAAIDPAVGGVLIEGPRGMAKSTSARALADLLPQGRFITLPLGATEERVVGTLNLEKILANGEVAFSPGLLHAAHGGVLYVDEVNLLPDHLVDLLLDVSASGINRVERDGVSHQHPARFVLVGTMNPDEGELRPQLLDRFGFAVALAPDLQPEQRMEIVKRRLAFDSDPVAFCTAYAANQTELSQRCGAAREALPTIPLNDSAHQRVAEICHQASVDGVRADLVMLRAARAHTAWCQALRISDENIAAVAELALHHRRRHTPPPQGQPPRQPAAAPTQQNGGDWGNMPPRNTPRGPDRDVTAIVKKKI